MIELIRKIGRTYSDGGMAELGRKVLRKLQRTGDHVPYQIKVGPSTNNQRWAKISAEIPKGSRNLLDIGSNLGDLTALAAAAGMWSIGIETSEELVNAASRRHKETPNCSFITAALDPLKASNIPRFDVTLLLSVHHHWHIRYGPDAAARMLNDVVTKTEKLIIFEGPSRTSRYEHNEPNFISNDEDSITAYYAEFLDNSVGHMVSNIKLLGKTPCVGDREPYRWMYALLK